MTFSDVSEQPNRLHSPRTLDSVEDHTVGFRQSADISNGDPCYIISMSFPTVGHYEAVFDFGGGESK